MKQKKISLIVIAIILASTVFSTSFFSGGKTQSSKDISEPTAFFYDYFNNQQYTHEEISRGKKYEQSNLSEKNIKVNYSSSNFGQTIYNYKNSFSPKKEYFQITQPGSDYYYYEPNHYSVAQNSFSNSPIMKIVDNAIEVVIKVDKNFDINYFEMVLNNVEAEIVINQSRLDAYVVKVPIGLVDQLQSQLEDILGFDYLEPHQYRSLLFTPNDPSWHNQWGPQLIGLEDAWEVNTGNRSIRVAIVDTGIDYNHEDLADAYLDIGYDWYNDDNDPFDDHYHGTHCAGTVAAIINNGLGIAGVANVSIFAEKIFNGDGNYTGDINAAAAIDHAAEQGAHVISNSWGGGSYSQIIADAVTNAVNNGSIVVAAAGNDYGGPVSFPANLPDVIAVSATDQEDNLASFSNYGEEIAVAAPGVNILSTIPGNNYDYLSGTSMATPHVSGLIALIMSEFSHYTSEQVTELLYLTADDLGPEGFDVQFGHGRINASRAMEGFPEHDLFIQLEVDTISKFGETLLLNTTTINNGLHTENNVEMYLYINEVMVESVIIESLEPKENYTLTYEWTPSDTSIYNITAYVEPVPDEEYIKNNLIITNVKVTDLMITDPIIIESNDDFSLKYGFPGTGTQEDPYRIQGYYISYTGTARIKITNTDAHFVIENCEIENFVYGSGIGINLTSVSNGQIINNKITNNWIGIYLSDASDSIIESNTIDINDYGMILENNSFSNLIENNTIKNNHEIGIGMWNAETNSIVSNLLSNNMRGFNIGDGCVSNIFTNNTITNHEEIGMGLWNVGNNTITNNTLSDNWRGFNIGDSSTTNIFSNNTITNHEEIGMGLWTSNHNTIINNSLLMNLYGIYLNEADSNIITSNNIYDNSNYGIYIDSGIEATIYNNLFVDNGGSSSQAYDSGENNTWYNETLERGNLWSDWSGSGSYSIDGSAGSEDLYPIVEDIPPVISNINYIPESPHEDDEITVTATVEDNVKVDTALLIYRTNSGSWQNLSMSSEDESTYSVTIGPLEAGTVVDFYIVATDTAENTAESDIISLTILDDIPPVISNINYMPENPHEDDEITVTAIVEDNVKVDTVLLIYRTNSGSWQNLSMSSEDESTYSVTIGPLEAGTVVDFYIVATDTAENTAESDIINLTISPLEETKDDDDDLPDDENEEELTKSISFIHVVIIGISIISIALIKYSTTKRN